MPLQFSHGTVATEASYWRFVAEQRFEVPVPPNSKDFPRADLERVNAELRSSLKQCRELLADCRCKLAANEGDKAAASHTERASNWQ